MAQNEILCYSCRGKRSIPGNCHIRCGPRTDKAMESPEGKLLEVLSIFGDVGRGPLAGVPNWMNFDPCFPNPVTKCEKYEPIAELVPDGN